MIEHWGMLNHLYAKIHALNLEEEDIVAQTASQCFDISVWQFLAALLVGGRVHIFADNVVLNPFQLIQLFETHAISIFETVPSLLEVLLDAAGASNTAFPKLPHLRWLIPTGEALPPELCTRWSEFYPYVPLLNAYGATECSDDVTHFPIYNPFDASVTRSPVGRPIENMQQYVLDRNMLSVPAGMKGEVYFG